MENEINPNRPTITTSYVDSLLSSQAAPDISKTCAFSDRIGLQQSFAAAIGHSMTYSPLCCHGSTVKVTASVYALQEAPTDEAGDCDVTNFRNDLHVYCIDDSSAVGCMLEHNILVSQQQLCRTPVGIVLEHMAEVVQSVWSG